VQLDQHRAARGDRRREQRGVAPEAAHRDVRVHRDASALQQRRGQAARRLERERAARREGAFAVRGEVFDRPALEQALGAVGFDYRCDAAARFGRGAEHDQARSGFGVHGVRLWECCVKARLFRPR
jgi:hypothetical protein